MEFALGCDDRSVVAVSATSMKTTPAVTAAIPSKVVGVVSVPIMAAVGVVKGAVIAPIAVIERAVRSIIIARVVVTASDG